MTSGGAGVGEENIFRFFRILVLSEDASRLDLVTNELRIFGYSVTPSVRCGFALEMVMKKNAIHVILIDDSVKTISIMNLFLAMKETAKNVCIIIFSPDYNLRNAKLYLGQGAQLVVPYDQIKSFYSVFWQFILIKHKFCLEFESLKEQRKKMRWDDETRMDVELTIPFAGPDPSARSVAELMTVTRINTQTVGNYMRKTRESRAGAAGAGPSVAQPPMQPSYLEQLAQVEAGTFGPSVAQPPMQPSHLEQLAQVEAGTSVAQPSFVFGAGTTDEGDVSFSDLDLFLDFTQH